MSARRLTAGLAAAACALAAGAWGLPGAAATSPTGLVAAAAAAPAFSTTVTVSRTHLVDGKDVTVDTRTVTLQVNVTKNLRDRQGIDISWSGAHPTGGILADTHSGAASQEEYPMVLLQCRGVDSPTAPVAKQIRPETCWTGTPVQRYTASYSPLFPAWRVDRYAAASQRTHNPGTPSPRLTSCFSEPPTEHWLHFVGANGTDFAGGPLGCAGIPPEASKLDSTTALPSNSTYAVTNLDGSGFSRFDIRDDINNGSLGCSSSVPCTIVAIPIMGISCDVAATGLPVDDVPVGTDATEAATECMKTGHFKPGSLIPAAVGDNDRAVSGELWWSASNWRNRISVPITLAPALGVCPAASAAGGSADIYGSEALVQATSSWIPKFCTGSSSVPVKHVQTGEPQARNLLGSASISAAFTSQAREEAYTRPTVHAPVAVTGFAITYTIDDAKGDRVDDLRLTPRLLAKLLTESYPAIPDIRSGYQALSDNPLDMSLDPEFIALNPGIKKGVFAGISASTMYAISSDSDVMYALTAYINADAEARAWLDGAADPWGMKVNPNYLKIALPVNSWPLLDSFEPKALYESGANPCLTDAPVPYLPLIASPSSRLASIAQAMQYSLANSQVVCVQPFPGTSVGQKLSALGRQSGGFRFMVGLAALGDAARFGLDAAALQTNVATGSGAAFTDGSGRTFVAPTDTGLRKAAALLTTATSPVDWQLPYDTMLSDPQAAGAYPGTMVVYADVPTSGLSAHDAKGFATFLAYVARTGQTAGQAIGQLPDGYLPMTKANGLAALAGYTARAAVAVSDQSGTVPPLVAPPKAAATPIPTPASGGTTTASDSGGDTPAAEEPTPSATASASPSTTSPATVAVSARTPAVDAGVAALAIPGLLGVVLLGALLAGIALLTSREPR